MLSFHTFCLNRKNRRWLFLTVGFFLFGSASEHRGDRFSGFLVVLREGVPVDVQGSGIGSLFCLKATESPSSQNPSRGNLNEFQLIWGDILTADSIG